MKIRIKKDFVPKLLTWYTNELTRDIPKERLVNLSETSYATLHILEESLKKIQTQQLVLEPTVEYWKIPVKISLVPPERGWGVEVVISDDTNVLVIDESYL